MGEDARQDRQDATGQTSSSATERVSVPQAADHLGTTVDAIRKRVQRGTIPHEKDTDGRVWILLDTGRPRQDKDQDTTGPRQDSELVAELRDRVAYLERQVEEEREARRRADTILAQLSQANAEQARTIRAIEAPITPTEPADPADPLRSEPDREDPKREEPERAEPATPAERRSWWARMFGG